MKFSSLPLLLLISFILSFHTSAQITLPFTESFNGAYSSNFYSSTGFSNTGATYTCSPGNGVGLVTSTSSFGVYLTTKTIFVSQGASVNLSFKLNKATGYSSSGVEVFVRINDAITFDPMNPTWKGFVSLGNATSFSCGSNIFSVPSNIAGGQRLCFVINFKSASTTNWVAIEDLSITETLGNGVPATYTESFNNGNWYNKSPAVNIPYHSYTTASNGYTYLWNSSGVTGNFGDYSAAFYTGYDGSNPSYLITPEINTSGHASGKSELRFAFRTRYPCPGPVSYTVDENYQRVIARKHTSCRGQTMAAIPGNCCPSIIILLIQSGGMLPLIFLNTKPRM